MPKRGKNYRAAAENIDKTTLYDADKALELVVENSKAKFDESVEVHLKLGVDGRHADSEDSERKLV